MKEEPRMSKKKRKNQSEKVMQRVLAVLLGLIVILMAILVGWALKLGVNVPDMSSGKIQQTESSSTEQPSQTAEPENSEPVTESSSEAEPEPEPDPALEKAQALLDSLTLEEKVGQMIFATPDSLTGVTGADIAGTMTQQALEEYPIGGVVYFSQNIKSASQITGMIEKTQSYSKIPLFIGVDEEGGRVSRLSRVGITDTLEPMAVYGEAGDEGAVKDIGLTIGGQLREAGFNLDFAPVADIITNPNNTEIGDRSFSSDPEVAAQMVAAMTEGLQESGVSACLKHFPGHGSTETDSHTALSISQRTIEELRQNELVPFKAGIEAGVGMIMISHMSLPNIVGDNTPCDLSYTIVTELLRQELGYDGVVITDSHEMGAITGSYPCQEAAVKAIQAGCDVVLMPQSVSQAYSAILAAVENGELTEERINESVLRILTLKYRLGLIEE